ncbi:hypothetical protein ACHAPU_009131 [Fusarium lateritium]
MALSQPPKTGITCRHQSSFSHREGLDQHRHPTHDLHGRHLDRPRPREDNIDHILQLEPAPEKEHFLAMSRLIEDRRCTLGCEALNPRHDHVLHNQSSYYSSGRTNRYIYTWTDIRIRHFLQGTQHDRLSEKTAGTDINVSIMLS